MLSAGARSVNSFKGLVRISASMANPGRQHMNRALLSQMFHLDLIKEVTSRV